MTDNILGLKVVIDDTLPPDTVELRGANTVRAINVGTDESIAINRKPKVTVDSQEFRERIGRMMRSSSIGSTRGWKAYKALVAMIDRLVREARPTWTKTEDRLPPDETPVIILYNGEPKIGELRWEHPGYEDTFKSFRYWDSPDDDGQMWEWHNVTHWMPIPDVNV